MNFTSIGSMLTSMEYDLEGSFGVQSEESLHTPSNLIIPLKKEPVQLNHQIQRLKTNRSSAVDNIEQYQEETLSSQLCLNQDLFNQGLQPYELNGFYQDINNASYLTPELVAPENSDISLTELVDIQPVLTNSHTEERKSDQIQYTGQVAQEDSVIQQVTQHLLAKKDASGDITSYGSDEISKKTIRKLCAIEVKKFKAFCKSDESSNLQDPTDMLKQYLNTRHGISFETLEVEQTMKLAKELYFPLCFKRVDQSFQHTNQTPGQRARNEFLRLGTKRAAIKFFSNKVGQIFYPNFKAIITMYIRSVPEKMSRKNVTFLRNLDNKMTKLSDNK